jgi:hypothetical protein
MNWYAYSNGNPIDALDPFGLWTWKSVAWNFAKGLVVGAAITAAIIVAAPVAATVGAAALGLAGVSAVTATTVATATVTGGLFAAGVAGTAITGINTYQAVKAGDWDAVAFNAGSLTGGLAVGAGGGGRSLANRLMGKPSPAPNTWNLKTIIKYEIDNSYKPSLGPPGLKYWATAPTPFSGGLSAALAASALSIPFQSHADK